MPLVGRERAQQSARGAAHQRPVRGLHIALQPVHLQHPSAPGAGGDGSYGRIVDAAALQRVGGDGALAGEITLAGDAFGGGQMGAPLRIVVDCASNVAAPAPHRAVLPQIDPMCTRLSHGRKCTSRPRLPMAARTHTKRARQPGYRGCPPGAREESGAERRSVAACPAWRGFDSRPAVSSRLRLHGSMEEALSITAPLAPSLEGS